VVTSRLITMSSVPKVQARKWITYHRRRCRYGWSVGPEGDLDTTTATSFTKLDQSRILCFHQQLRICKSYQQTMIMCVFSCEPSFLRRLAVGSCVLQLKLPLAAAAPRSCHCLRSMRQLSWLCSKTTRFQRWLRLATLLNCHRDHIRSIF
jgi:hypothetical protein